MSPSKEARQFVMQRVKGILIPLFSRLMEEKPADPKAFILQELQGQAAPEIVNWQIDWHVLYQYIVMMITYIMQTFSNSEENTK